LHHHFHALEMVQAARPTDVSSSSPRTHPARTPEPWIYELDEHGVRRVEYDGTATVRVTSEFLGDPDATLEKLFLDD
jgi:hypothetical protein